MAEKKYDLSESDCNEVDFCIPRSKKDIGALKKGQAAVKRGQLKNCQI